MSNQSIFLFPACKHLTMASTFRRSTLTLLRAAKERPALSTAIRLNNTDAKILTSVFKEIKTPYTSVNDFVWQNLDRWPDKTAVVCV